MTATKATLRRDGEHRVTLRIEVHLDVDAMAAAIAEGSYEDADTISSASLRQLLEWARNGVRTLGMDDIHMRDTDDYADEVEAARGRLVELGVFPPDSLMGAVSGEKIGEEDGGL